LKDHLRQQVRSAPHVSGTALVKPRDYQPLPEGEGQEQDVVEATSPYAAFFALRDGGRPLEVGDLLEAEDGSLRIFKFVGFEDAQWVLPEAKPPMESQEQPAAVQ
jgi:hypothetical protein